MNTNDGKVLILRTCTADMKSPSPSAKGFIWPKEGQVEAPDWDPDPQRDCGGGLHGLLWGKGNYSLLYDDEDAIGVVVEADAKDVIVRPGKARFRGGRVVFVGGVQQAFEYVAERAPQSETPERKDSAKDLGQATASGDLGQATASGDLGQATASCYRGQATASGDRGQATASGYLGQATASGYLGQATASGYRGQATASGHRGQATASGYLGQATASGSGIAMGLGGEVMVSGGSKSCLIATWWDDEAERPRVTVGYVGERGLQPDTKYRLNKRREFEPVEEGA